MSVLRESPANVLCKSCGLCCTGHLFIWTKLRAAELNAMESLGLKVVRSVPSQRGFNQPCPLWQGQCTIYTSSDYPRFCQTYKCKLLKQLLEENISLSQALTRMENAKEMVQEVEALLPDAPNPNFRERLVAALGESSRHDPELQQKAALLLAAYENVFGVGDVIDPPDETESQ